MHSDLGDLYEFPRSAWIRGASGPPSLLCSGPKISPVTKEESHPKSRGRRKGETRTIKRISITVALSMTTLSMTAPTTTTLSMTMTSMISMTTKGFMKLASVPLTRNRLVVQWDSSRERKILVKTRATSKTGTLI